jgi:hypothetical protein
MHNLADVIAKKDWYFATPTTLGGTYVDEVWVFLVAQDAEPSLGIPNPPAQLIALPPNTPPQGPFPPDLIAIPAASQRPAYPQPFIAVYHRLAHPLVAQYYALAWNSLMVPPVGSVLTVCPPLEVNELFTAMRMV